MKKANVIIAICIGGIFFVSFSRETRRNAPNKTPEDSLAVERRKFINLVMDSLKGREKTAADSVFKNLQVFNSSERVPVTHFLAIMDYWGESLGVNCTYCHSPSNWPSDALRSKRIARDMYNMRQRINHEILPTINGLSSKTPEVNCITCHNGKIIPQE